MKYRDLIKANTVNDGSRSLFESIMVPEVDRAFKDWIRNTADVKYVLIGGVALSYYVKPRTTTDADLLFMSPEDIPATVEGFKRTRPGAFTHKLTHVEIEVLTPQAINLPPTIAQAVYDHANVREGIRIASPSGLVATKLGRFKLQDQADIAALIDLGPIDLTPYAVPPNWQARFDQLAASLK